jgi:hypothetical protein
MTMKLLSRTKSDIASKYLMNPPPLPETGVARQKMDLWFVFSRVSFEALLHLYSNFDRLATGAYQSPGGKGCLFYLLSEVYPPEQRIFSKQSLIRQWTGVAADQCYAPEYQPAKYLVRAFDGHRTRRYLGELLIVQTIRQVLCEVLEAQVRDAMPPNAASTFDFPDEELS